jgi:hypothetical protein
VLCDKGVLHHCAWARAGSRRHLPASDEGRRGPSAGGELPKGSCSSFVAVASDMVL